MHNHIISIIIPKYTSATFSSDPNDVFRPVIGGVNITIAFRNETGAYIFGFCTTGSSATYSNGDAGIITAGHCIADIEEYNPIEIRVYQPSPNSWNDYEHLIGQPLVVNCTLDRPENDPIYGIDGAFIDTEVSDVDSWPLIRWPNAYPKPVAKVISWRTIGKLIGREAIVLGAKTEIVYVVISEIYRNDTANRPLLIAASFVYGYTQSGDSGAPVVIPDEQYYGLVDLIGIHVGITRKTPHKEIFSVADTLEYHLKGVVFDEW